MPEHLSQREVRRLALARAGLLTPERTGLPRRASGRGVRARRAAQAVIERFGYLQIDTIAVAGARSHSLVLCSRLEGFDAAFAEDLLQPGQPLFEYWGHEASWLPLDLYPTFGFRRLDCVEHPWWGDVLGEHPDVADIILEKIRAEGPLRTADLEELAPDGPRMDTWYPRLAKRVALTFWSRGDLVIRERRGFQRVFDLAERVIPEEVRRQTVPQDEALPTLLLRALAGFGWAQTGTLAATWRLRNLRTEIATALSDLEASGAIVACTAEGTDGKTYKGWVRPADLELAGELVRARPARDRGVLLSPFDPLLWDRVRTARLLDFEHIMEIFKPVSERTYGYYCMPVVAGDRLIARVDLKADRKRGRLELLCCHHEAQPGTRERAAVEVALERHCHSVRMALDR